MSSYETPHSAYGEDPENKYEDNLQGTKNEPDQNAVDDNAFSVPAEGTVDVTKDENPPGYDTSSLRPDTAMNLPDPAERIHDADLDALSDEEKDQLHRDGLDQTPASKTALVDGKVAAAQDGVSHHTDDFDGREVNNQYNPSRENPFGEYTDEQNPR